MKSIREFNEERKTPPDIKSRNIIVEKIEAVTKEVGDLMDGAKAEIQENEVRITLPAKLFEKEEQESIAVTNFPDLQKVEVTNFPEQKETTVNVPAPIVNVEPPIVNVTASEVVVDVEGVKSGIERMTEKVVQLNETAKTINENISKKEEFGPVRVYDKNGRVLDWEQLFRAVSSARSSPGLTTAIQENTLGTKPLSGTSANGTRALTVADTWYAVPSTVPSTAYVLVATVENAVGTVRFAFDNTGTPSATNGNQAPSQLTVKLASGQVVYFASSTAGDDVNWTTKQI